MDASILHAATEDFANYWSEVTVGDLSSPVPGTAGDIGDLYCATLAAYRLATASIAGSAPRRWHAH
ncbi:hypothetical protein [Phycicoccus jejuensis]|uniref:hypothetical protein n=1 Tax=Phycicoccus jejuensis TaxID=367299 RepID=UPI0004C354B3|nr:hypothetical protein [Phycicoccus jejuensis]